MRQLIRIKRGLQPSVIEVGNLKPRRTFLDVSDALRGFYLAAMKGKRGEAYNLCASNTHTIGGLLRIATRLAGLKAEVRPLARLTGWKPKPSLEQPLASMLEYWCRRAVGRANCNVCVNFEYSEQL